MPNIANALKAEISRVARKEVKGEALDMKKASSQHRAQIAALRKRLDSLERQLKRATKAGSAAQTDRQEQSAETVHRRFSAGRLAATRKRLGLSAADFGALIGVTGQSIYKWEAGQARPRAKQLEALASVRGIGKREAAARLEASRHAE